MQLFTAGHDNRNYLAAGALGPDLFFLLPDFKGDLGNGLMKLMRFALGGVAGRRQGVRRAVGDLDGAGARQGEPACERHLGRDAG